MKIIGIIMMVLFVFFLCFILFHCYDGYDVKTCLKISSAIIIGVAWICLAAYFIAY